MESLRQDLRYGVRSLLKSPGFAIAAVLSLALGIGANTAIFTLANAVFLHPMPVVVEPTRVLEVYTVDRATGNVNAHLVRTPVSYLNYVDFRDQNGVFSGLAAFFQGRVIVSGRGTPKPQPVELVSANYFDVLGVPAILGRTFQPNEDKQPGANAVTVISYGLWTRMFAADRNAIGQTINFNATPYTIIGVTPPGFKGTQTMTSAEVAWVPTSMHAQVLKGPFEQFFNERRARLMYVFGRLKPGVSPAQALASLKSIASRLEQEYPKANKGRSAETSLLAENALGFLPRDQMIVAGIALFAVVGLLLLIASANLANLLLARAARRAQEMSIRTALGAERGRLMRQLLTENLLLFMCGGVAGLIVGQFGCKLLWSFRPADIAADGIPIAMDWQVFAFTAAVTLTTGLLFGMIPALRASSPNIASVLRAGTRSGTAATTSHRLRAALVAGELALAVVCLTGAGLFIRSMSQAERVDVGFDTKNLLVFNFDLASRHESPEKSRQFLRTVTSAASDVPGVQSVAFASSAPISGGFARTVLTQEQSNSPDEHGHMAIVNAVSPTYFSTMRIPLQRGRAFTEFDRANTAPVVVISEALARQLWPNESPLGKRIRFQTDGIQREIVGVTANVTMADIGEPPQPVTFLPLEQEFTTALTVHVRTAASPAATLRSVLPRVQALDENLALTDAATIQQVMDQNLWAPRAGAALFTVFGILGLALASVGVYGVMANMVVQRTSEIGIRMALGAPVNSVVAMVVRQSMKLAGLGIVLGIAAALGISGLLRSLLFGIGPRDPLTYLVVSGVLLTTALLAGFLPARRAARIDPVEALRQS